ncbi:MAG: tetratricopeptide repeat protein [Candidatus Micrarchaeota archaeon]|nr:tetratricopeptide repeat protein [Candidatus Micrarchaeota archaeon]
MAEDDEKKEVLDAEAYYEKGNYYYEQGDYDRAIENYNMAIILNPKFLECYFNRALCYYNKKNYDKAIDDYTKAIEIDPDNPMIYNNRGDAYYRKQDFERAIADYNKAISINPEYLKAYYNRGLAYASMQDYESGVENFTKVIELDPNFVEAYNARGLAYEFLEKYDEAIADYQKALEINPNFTEAQEHLAAAQKKKSEKEASSGEGVSAVKFMAKPKVTFKDVVGMDNVKELIREYIVYPLKDPDLARKYGKFGGGGVLFYGPPGCGKTFIMKAAAGEVGANFLNVKLSDVLDMYVGNTEKNIRNIFEAARKASPCIIFIDEIDGLGGRREQMKESGQYMRMAVNQLLYEMDGVEARNENVLVVAATNSPWDVDPALRRAGRFSKLIYVGEPDYASRKAMFQYYAKGRPVSKNVDWDRLARATEGFSSSDIKAISDDAAAIPWIEALKTGKQREITMKDYIEVLDPLAADPIKYLLAAKKPKGKKSSLPPWYESAKKEIGKQEEVETVDGKEIKRVKEPKMPPGEREYFKELIDLIESRNKPHNKFLLWLWRKSAIYQDYIAPFLIAGVVYILYLTFQASLGF